LVSGAPGLTQSPPLELSAMIVLTKCRPPHKLSRPPPSLALLPLIELLLIVVLPYAAYTPPPRISALLPLIVLLPIDTLPVL
jgi:hypothetical protein